MLSSVDRKFSEFSHSSLTPNLFPPQIASLPLALTCFWIVIGMAIEKGLACWPSLQGVPLYRTSVRSNKIARPLVALFLSIFVFTRPSSRILKYPVCGEDQTAKPLRVSPGSFFLGGLVRSRWSPTADSLVACGILNFLRSYEACRPSSSLNETSAAVAIDSGADSLKLKFYSLMGIIAAVASRLMEKKESPSGCCSCTIMMLTGRIRGGVEQSPVAYHGCRDLQ